MTQEVAFHPRALLSGPLPFPTSMPHDLRGMMYKTQMIRSLNNL